MYVMLRKNWPRTFRRTVAQGRVLQFTPGERVAVPDADAQQAIAADLGRALILVSPPIVPAPTDPGPEDPEPDDRGPVDPEGAGLQPPAPAADPEPSSNPPADPEDEDTKPAKPRPTLNGKKHR